MTAPVFRPATDADHDALEAIRAAAFAPVFASFRKILGDVIYGTAQRHEDEAQAGYLTSLFKPDSDWRLTVAELDGRLVGFLSVQVNASTRVGEIGLNAVDPRAAGMGVGTAMYELALDQMREAGAVVATVATGGDPSHAPARRAYAKAGFDVTIPSVWMCREL